MSEKEQHEGQIVDAQQDLNKKGRNLFNKQKLGGDLTQNIQDLQKKIDTVGGDIKQTNKLSDKEKTSFLTNQKKLEDTNGKIDGKKKHSRKISKNKKISSQELPRKRSNSKHFCQV